MANNGKKKNKKKRPLWKRSFRFLSWAILIVLILFLLLVLFIRSPWGQNIIVGKVTKYVSDRTQTEVSIKKLYITFSGAIDLEGLYLEDKKGDTLIYSKELIADVPLLPIIRGNPISIDGVQWTGLRANILRKDSVDGFNYQFLIDAFASDSTSTDTDTTSSKVPKISIGTINFSDFKVNYDDAVTGMKANLDLGKFHFEGKNFDLKKMKFEAEDIVLENTKVTYEQTKPIPPSDTDTTETTLPFLSLGNLKLKNVTAHYKSIPDSIDANLDLKDLKLQVPKADLANQNIEVGDFELNNSSIVVRMKPEAKQAQKQVSVKKEEPFIWPDWDIQVESIALQNNHLHYQAGEKPIKQQKFDPNYIDLTNFNFKANDIALSKDKSAKLKLNNLSFNESSGLALEQLAFSAAVDSTSVAVDDLLFKTGNSSLNANLKTQFASLQNFIKHPEKSRWTLNLNQFSIDLNDAFAFQPELKKNEYLEKLSKHKFTGEIKVNGKLAKVNLSKFIVNWGQHTSIKTQGELMNLTDIDKLTADINNFTFKSTKADLTTLVSEKELGITIPETITLQSRFHGSLNDLKTQTELIIPEGKIKVDGSFKNKKEIAFNAKIDVIDFNLGKILQNPNIGNIAFEMKASGKGNTLNDLNAQLASQFSKLEFNGYDFSALQLDGKMDDGKGAVTLNYKDKNLNLNIDSKIQLDSISPKIAVDFNLKGADLRALGLTKEDFKTRLMIKANFKGNADKFDFDSHFSNGVAVYNKNTYYLGNIDLSAGVRKDSTAVDISSNFLNGKLRSNANPDRISKAIQQQLKSYFTDSIASIDSVAKPVQLKMNMELSETKLLTEVLLPDIKAMDTLNLNVDFNQQKNKLNANLNLPYLNYADKTIDSLQFKLNSTADAAKFKFGFSKLNADPFAMNRTYFNGELHEGVLSLNFNAFDGEKEIYVLQSEISGKNSELMIHLLPEKLVLQGKPWTIPSDNQITIQKKEIIAKDFVLSRNTQSVSIANDLGQTTQNNIGIGFKDFKLITFMALFNKNDFLASGDLQGNIIAVNPLGNLGLVADFSINNLSVLKAPLGKLTLKAKSENGDNYDFNLGIKGNDIDLTLNGDYVAKKSGAELNLDLNLNKIGMKTIATLSGESLKDASGNISGKIAVKGEITSPKYEGYLQFNDAAFNVSQLNSKFRLANDKIKINNDGITLNKFSIEDKNKNTFTIDGSISTKKISDPEFDLTINAKNFQALNSSEKDNNLYYGKVNFDMDGTIKGKMSFPKVNLNIGIDEGTDFTYVIPESQATIEKSDGIIEFVNKKNPDNILTRTNDSSVVAKFNGIELHTKVNIDKRATFNVITDPRTGDNLKVSGEGTLDFNIARNGRTTLTGRYKINSGHYKLSLYNLVKRKFELEQGGTVVWHGDPINADINVTAKYSLKTSASALMASETAGESAEVRNKYRQVLPFFVFLNVQGELDKPKLNFRLGMPEDSRGIIGGSIYSKITQLNDEEEGLNKQVFSLLVLNKFYPNSSSDGSGGGTASIARDNINQALSDQLNTFSDKLTGNTGIQLNFGLNSYTDYQGKSAEERTDLSVNAQKKLFNDRVVVQVGSEVNVKGSSHPGEENPVVGNASIAYLLTKDGRWRLKGFRNSEYENVIDGQVFVNGIGLIFQRQFNKLSELFGTPPKEMNDSTEDNKNDKATENSDRKPKTDKNNSN